MTRVIGPPRSKRRRWTLLVPFIAAVAVTLLMTVGAQAVNNTGAFELDGNAVTSHSGTGAPDDWDRVCHQVVGSDCSTTTNTNGATAVSWTDSSNSLEIYTGGGSKDFNDTQDSWLWKPADTVPDKDTILHAFSARYSLTPSATTCPSNGDPTCEVIFFGSDRFDNAGDSQLGFWFFQNKIQTTNISSGGGFQFSGHHKNGDLLIISSFSNGGTTSTIKAYFWDTTCTKAASGSEDSVPVGGCPAVNLRLQGKSTAANCATSAATAAFCGEVNPTDGTTSPWAFHDKTNHTAFQQGEFYEAGVNLSKLGIGTECFSSSLAESRSSDSTSAVLKDFVLSNFGNCTTGSGTTPQKLNADGTTYSNITSDLSIGTAARVGVRDQDLIQVGGASTFGGTVKFFLCGPLALTSTSNCQTGGVQIGAAAGETVTGSGGTATVNSVGATLTKVGRYCWRAEYSGDSAKGVPASTDPANATSTTECFKVQPVTATLSTTAGSDVTLGTAITDTATLSGTAKQPGTDGIGPGGTINATAGTQANAGGSIGWVVNGPGNCTASGLTVTGTPATVSGDNTYGPVSATPTAIGTYTFVATYTPDTSGNTLGAAGSCPPGANDGDETVTVSGSASLATAQRWLPNDTAHITSQSGTTLAGSVTFTLYNDATCGAGTGTSQYTVTRNVVTDADANPAPTANDRYVSTTNTAFFVTSANDETAWSWKVHYVDNNLTSPSDACETTTPAFTVSP